jgi:hypothetical protein
MRLTVQPDALGFLRATVVDGPPIIGWWLEQDVQQSVGDCDELLSLIDAVRAGRPHPDVENGVYEGTGNSHTLTLRPDGARLETEFAEPPARADLTLDEVARAITAWREALLAQPGQRLA